MNHLNQLVTNIGSSTKNLHVSIPVVLAIACEVGKVWLPSHATQFDTTQKILLGYGVISAANSGPQPPKQ